MRVAIWRRSLPVAVLTSVFILAMGVAAAGAAERSQSGTARAITPGPLPGGGYVSASTASSPELVALIQRRLVRRGSHVRVDGVFGGETEASVRRFQAARRLVVDGVVGRQTMAALTRPGTDASGAIEGGQSRLERQRRRGRGAGARDRDRDGLPDHWERRHGLSTGKRSARRDNDRDGLDNLAELRSHTRPRDRNSDHDRLMDADEDPDRDRVDNGTEVRARTHPRRRDSDRDGRPDGREDRDRDRLANADEDGTGNDPADADSDEDGVGDGDEWAGTVVSFQNGTLTIERVNGGRVAARVTEDTGLDCVGEDESGDSEAPASDEPDGDADEDQDDSDGDVADASGGGGEDDAPDPCLRALVPGAGIRSAELDDGAEAPEWSEVEVVE